MIFPRTILLAWVLTICAGISYAQPSTTRVLVAFYSEQGHTQAMAESVVEGIRSAGVEVDLYRIDGAPPPDVTLYDAIVIGTPVHNANVAVHVQQFINSWPFSGSPMRGKLGAVFVTGGGISAGEELVQMNVLQSMLIFGMVVMGGPEWTSPFGASAITNEEPFKSSDAINEQFIKKGHALGKRVAEMSIRLKN